MQNYKYYAFISYARKDSTKQAKYIQKELEHYRYPMAGIAEFRMPNDKQYLRKIFLDLNELENSVKTFQEELLHKIENSKYLIVLCSLESAKSKWVSEEIEYFLKTHNNDYSFIVPVLINGKVPDNIPKILQRQDILNRNLPTFVEFDGDDKNEAKERGLSQLIAYLLGLQRDKVSNRFQVEKRKQQLKLIKIFAVLLVLFVCLTTWALFERKRAIDNEKIAIKQREEQRYILKFYERMLGLHAAEHRNITVKDLLERESGRLYEHDDDYTKIQFGLSILKILIWHNQELASDIMEEIYKLIDKLPTDLKNIKLADFYKIKGDFYKLRFEYNLALEFYQKALFYKFDTLENYCETNFQIANCYEQLRDYNNSEKYFLEYIEQSKKADSQFLKELNFRKAYERLTIVCICAKNYEKALFYTKKFLELETNIRLQVMYAELKYLIKQYNDAMNQVKKNGEQVRDYNNTDEIEYILRNNIINVLAYSKLHPEDTEGAKKCNIIANESFNSLIDAILNDDNLDFDNKKVLIRKCCIVNINKLLLLQDIDIHFYELQYLHYSYNIRRVETYTIFKNYKRAIEIGDEPELISTIENPILKLKLYALLKYDYKMLYEETGDSQYKAKENQYYNEYMNLYPKVQEEIKNAKYTPAQKAVLLDEIKIK